MSPNATTRVPDQPLPATWQNTARRPSRQLPRPSLLPTLPFPPSAQPLCGRGKQPSRCALGARGADARLLRALSQRVLPPLASPRPPLPRPSRRAIPTAGALHLGGLCRRRGAAAAAPPKARNLRRNRRPALSLPRSPTHIHTQRQARPHQSRRPHQSGRPHQSAPGAMLRQSGIIYSGCLQWTRKVTAARRRRRRRGTRAREMAWRGARGAHAVQRGCAAVRGRGVLLACVARARACRRPPPTFGKAGFRLRRCQPDRFFRVDVADAAVRTATAAAAAGVA
eukprot:360516-Chlamydomonas_euryale.AAC.8